MLCPRCSQENTTGAMLCSSCLHTLPQLPAVTAPPKSAIKPRVETASSLGDDAAIRMLLPVGRSGLAIAAGYLGLFSLLGFFAPIAVVVSILAIRQLRRNPKLHGMGRAVFGLIMGSAVSLLLGAAILFRK